MIPPIPECFIAALAAVNEAPAAVRATLLTCMIVAAFMVLPYALGRGRPADHPPLRRPRT